LNKTLDFICIGAQKSGTTSLHDVLSQHPKICLPKIKETQFFLNSYQFEKELSYYFKNYFHDCTSETLCKGEVDPELLFSEQAPQRLYDSFGSNLKIIVILRDPVKRAFSQYQMSKSRGIEEFSFLEAVKMERQRVVFDDTDKGPNSKRKHFSYISRSLYVEQLERYFNLWDKNNLKIVIFEELLTNKNKYYDEICDFIGVSDFNFNLNLKSNKASESINLRFSKLINTENRLRNLLGVFIPAPFKSKILKFLRSISTRESSTKLAINDEIFIYKTYFHNEIETLEKLLNRDLSVWKK